VEESLAEAASAATPEQPDTAITEADALRKRVQVHDALARVLADLSPEDLVITRLHFSKGLSLGDVARVLGLPQKPLYRRVERLRLTLRQHLESEGVDESIVQEELANGIDG
jgi:RNA polymerase sigma factor for flagellar operon FliA